MSDLKQEQRFGNISGVAELFNVIQERIWFYCSKKEQDYYAQSELYSRLFADYLQVFSTYSTWGCPTSWRLDHLDDDGAFGILLTGQYTCLVMLRSNGTVTGHS